MYIRVKTIELITQNNELEWIIILKFDLLSQYDCFSHLNKLLS